MLDFEFQDHVVKYTESGSGTCILFLHNGGTSHIIWKDLMRQLENEYHIYAIDLPGFGSSLMPESGYNLERYTDLVIRFISNKISAPTHLVGNCMGSAMAIAAAREIPTKILSLTLVNPLTNQTYSKGMMGSTLWLEQNVPFIGGIIKSAVNRISDPPNILVRQIINFQLGSKGTSKRVFDNKELQQCYKRKDQMPSLTKILPDLANYDWINNFQPDKSFPPIFTIWGEQNRVLSSKAGRKLNEKLCPRAEKYLPDCGHLVMLEDPETVAMMMRNFFTEIQ